MARILFLIISCLFIANQAVIAAPLDYTDVGLPIARIHTAEEHQAGSQVWWINSDEHNRIYISSSNGLARWDGERWEQFNTPKESIVRSFVQWHDGRFYAGTNNDLGYFSDESTGNMQWTSLLPHWRGLPGDIGEVMSVAANSHYVAYSSQYKLLLWNNRKLTEIPAANTGSQRLFSVDDMLLVKPENSPFIHHITESGQLEPTSWRLPEGATLRMVVSQGNGTLVVLTTFDGMFRLTETRSEQVLSADDFAQGEMLYNGIQASDGYFYITSIQNGIYVIDSEFNVLRNYQEQHGIGAQTVLAVHEDKTGNIWVTGEPNLSVFAPPHLRSRQMFAGVSSNIDAIELEQGVMLASGMAAYQYQPSTNRQPPYFEQVPGMQQKVWHYERLDEQTMLISAAQGVYAMDIRDNRLVGEPRQVVKARNVQEIKAVMGLGLVYAGDENYLYRIQRVDGEWQYAIVQGLRNQFEYVLVEYSENTQPSEEVVWASASDGTLYRLANIDAQGSVGQLDVFDPDKFNLGNDNVALFLIGGRVHIGTSEGIYLYTPNKPNPLTLLEQVPDILKTPGKDVFLLEQTHDGRLLYQSGAHTGIASKLEDEWLVDEWMFNPFNRSGVRGLHLYNDAIWFSNAVGDAFRFSQNKHPQPPAARLLFHSIEDINDGALMTNFTPGNPLSAIPNERNSIRIAFSLPDHSSPLPPQYRTRMHGQRHLNWTKWSSEAHKDFPLLAGGNYTFEVEARNGWGRVVQGQLQLNNR